MEYFDHVKTFPDGAMYCGQSSATMILPSWCVSSCNHPVPLRDVVKRQIAGILGAIRDMSMSPNPTMLDSTGHPLRGGECSVYNGTAGVLLALSRSYTALPPTSPLRAQLLDNMQHLFPIVLGEVRSWKHGLARGVGYYLGPIGTHLVLLECGSMIAGGMGGIMDRQRDALDEFLVGCAAALLDLLNTLRIVVAQDINASNEEETDHSQLALDSEHLYGIAGTLLSLRTLELLVTNFYRQRWTNTQATLAIVVSHRQYFAHYLVLCGSAGASVTASSLTPAPRTLSWRWRGEHYIGAAHGTVGILTELLEHAHLLPAAEQQAILRSVDAIVDISYARDGHLPTRESATSTTDSSTCLVHWCHGAPGVVWMALAAYRSTADPAYLTAAATVIESVVFPFGMLRKGTGLCHGASGNAYCFLAMYRATRHPRYLYYAHRYAAMMSTPEYLESVRTYQDSQRVVSGIPDTPLGLMEGSSGALCFLVELLYAPTTSAFPGYEVPGHDSSITAVEWMGLGASSHSVKLLPEIQGSHRIAAPWYITGQPQLCSDHRSDGDVGMVAPGIPAVRCNLFTAMEANHILRAATASQAPRDLGVRPVRIGTGPATAPLLRYLTHVTERIVSLFPDLFFCPPPTKLMTARAVYCAPLNVNKERMWRRKNLCLLNRRAVQRLHLTSAYVVNYDCEKHTHVHSHTDASHVTLNLCLWNSAPAGNLVLEGDEGLFSFWHTVGEALVQRGDLPHHTHHLLDAPQRIVDWKQRHSTRHPLPDVSQYRRAQLVALFEFEEEESDFQAMLFNTCGPAIGKRCLAEVPECVLGDISLYLPLCDVGKLASCGSRVWQRVLDPNIGGVNASMLWCSRVMATRRLAIWLPYLWPEYCGEGAAGYGYIAWIAERFKIAKHDKHILQTPSIKRCVDELRISSGIAREVGTPPAAQPEPIHPLGARRVSFGLSPHDNLLPRWVKDHQGSVATAQDLNMMQRIDWRALLRHGLDFVNTSNTFFRRPLDNDGEVCFDDDLDDDGDSGGGTGSSYTNPAVEREAARLAGVFKDTRMTQCWRCLELVELAMDAKAGQGATCSEREA
jgi:hypothetical protein